MTQSVWNKFGIEAKIVSILKQVKHQKPFHHFRRPFLSPYQIAILFKEKYSSDFNNINMPIGGKKLPGRDTFSRYIAKELSGRIKNHKITNIEGAFLHLVHLEILGFKVDEKILKSSLGGPSDLSIFRYVDNNE